MSKLHLHRIEKPNRMISYWKAEWRVALVIVITGILYNGAMELGPILQGKIIDLLVAGASEEIIVRWILIFILTIVGIQVSRYLKRYYVRVFANRTSTAMRRIVYGNMINRDIARLKDEKTGDLMTKAISDVGECVEGMRKFTTEIFDTGILMTAYFITLLFYDVRLTVAASVFIPIAIFIAERMKTVVYRFTKSYRQQLSQVSEITLENIEHELLYRMHGVTEIKARAYEKELLDLEQKAVRANVLENSMQPVYKAIALIGIILVVCRGGQMVVSGGWSIGSFSAYITIFAAFSIKVSKAAKLFNSVQKAQVSWQRIKPYLHTDQKEKTAQSYTAEQRVSLQVKDLSFRIIDHAELHVETGEMVGITGPVASGKSTLGMVLQGLYPYAGSITVNGKELRDLEPDEVSRYITYMGHHSQLLSDTIYHNITLGEEGDISQVLRDVCFEKDLKTMPQGIHTLVGVSGIRLSGGQQARLALARALYNRSRILVLDDPFAAVDIATERKIISSLRENYRDCAILLLSHRISSFRDMEQVILINEGRTCCGTHEDLMHTSKVYREIFMLQEEGEDV